jgi:hypothetical protein
MENRQPWAEHLDIKNETKTCKIHTPHNLETLNLSFRGERVAQVIPILNYEIQRLTNLPAVKAIGPSQKSTPR